MRSPKDKNRRLLSLDALRGFDMLFIMGGEAFVISLMSLFPGDASDIVIAQMGHKAWHGLAFYDIIFPLFLFMAGISTSFSLSKQLSTGKGKRDISLRILRRCAMLLFLGMLYNGLLGFDFENMRYASVLGRIGLAWALASLLYLWTGRRFSVIISVAVLLGYWALLALVKAPDAAASVSIFSMEGSVVGYVDRILLPGRLHDAMHDPEGLLSTLPAMVTAMLGIFTGELVRKEGTGEYKKVVIMTACSLLLLSVGYMWGELFPVNKNLWTSSFVCCAGGWSMMLFAVFYLLIDVVGFRKWAFPLRVIGMNSITIYMAQQFFDFHRPVQTVFGGLLSLFPESLYATAYWSCYILVCWLFLYLLYRNKLFLKV
ncbi:MAG: DUF5009 domain-containing protein [Bacteroidaceae bacterium]|nr:DUF5009 domain-containing protein [Bacteroidaceae bacterium]